MTAVSNPIVTVKLIPDQSNVSLAPRRILVVGTIAKSLNAIFEGSEKTAYLNISTGSSYEAVSDASMRTMIGDGDTYERFIMAKKASGGLVPIDLLLVKNEVADGAGKTITVSTVPTINTTIKAFVYNKQRYSVAVAYKVGQTASDLAAALAAAFVAIDNKPFDVTVSGAALTVTYKDGLCLGYVPIHFECDDKTFKAIITGSETLPTAPQNDLFDVIGDVRYTQILYPSYYRSKLTVVDSLLKDRFNTRNAVKDGRAYIGLCANLVNSLEATDEFNTQSIFVASSPLLDRANYAGGANFTTDDIYCAFMAGAIARMQTDGADITDLISGAEGLRDYSGGGHIASLPLHNMPVTDSIPTKSTLYWNQTEQEQLTAVGLSTWGANVKGNTVISGDCRTLWKTDAAGNENLTWSQLEFMETSSIVRERVDSWLRITTGKTRMTDGDIVSGLSMIDEQAMMEKWLVFYDKDLADLGLVIKGAKALKALRANTNFKFVFDKTKIEMTGKVTIVTHVGEVDYNMQIVV